MTTNKDTDVFGADALQHPQQAPQKAVEAVVEASLVDAIPIVKEAFKAAVEDVGVDVAVAGILGKTLEHYSYLLSCIVGEPAEVVTVDSEFHQNDTVFITAPVVSYDKETGEFETAHTVFKPLRNKK